MCGVTRMAESSPRSPVPHSAAPLALLLAPSLAQPAFPQCPRQPHALCSDLTSSLSAHLQQTDLAMQSPVVAEALLEHQRFGCKKIPSNDVSKPAWEAVSIVSENAHYFKNGPVVWHRFFHLFDRGPTSLFALEVSSFAILNVPGACTALGDRVVGATRSGTPWPWLRMKVGR